jgi:hypothetical protein
MQSSADAWGNANQQAGDLTPGARRNISGSSKGKSLVASVFEHSTKKPFDYLDCQIQWDQTKYKKESMRNEVLLDWEKQKYQDDKDDRQNMHKETIKWEKEKFKDQQQERKDRLELQRNQYKLEKEKFEHAQKEKGD